MVVQILYHQNSHQIYLLNHGPASLKIKYHFTEDTLVYEIEEVPAALAEQLWLRNPESKLADI